ncbi:MAG: 23S rRNA (guanosine(2251)-2'-O)-methyltransferase RlmB [Alphaproteobacteria bacterium]|nr:23S rRNA (guanosine(2251)-2'-O)-methyltransferase RlmB [Alphaproteobacteria bacterium]
MTKKKFHKRYYIYGKHACMLALQNKNRQIYKIFSSEENRHLIDEKFLDITKFIKTNEFENILGGHFIHQNICAHTSILHNKPLEEINFSQNAKIALLDQISDPQNLGAILRNAASFGFEAIIVPEDNSPGESGTVAKAASGALEIVPIIRATNLVNSIKKLKKMGFWITGLDIAGSVLLNKVDFNTKSCIVLGAEGGGIRRLVRENCDILTRINIDPGMESLNVASTSAICFYEATRLNFVDPAIISKIP